MKGGFYMQTIDDLKALQELHRQQMKENRDKILARKRRAHRLIVRGAIAEKLVKDADKMTDKEFQKELYRLLKVATDSESTSSPS